MSTWLTVTLFLLVAAAGLAVGDRAAREAHAELVTRLRELGWEPVGSAVDAWHRLRFEERPAGERLAVAAAQ